MGTFNPGPRVRRIEFDDDTEFPGLWMRVGGLSLDEWLGLKIGEAVDLFADRLIEWNWVDDNDNPVPCTRDGVGTLDVSDARTLVALWSDQSAEVRRRPFAGAATNGAPPDPEIEAGIPMQPPSPAAES